MCVCLLLLLLFCCCLLLLLFLLLFFVVVVVLLWKNKKNISTFGFKKLLTWRYELVLRVKYGEYFFLFQTSRPKLSMRFLMIVFVCVNSCIVIAPPSEHQPPQGQPANLEDLQRLHSDVFTGYNKNLLPLNVLDKPVIVQCSLNLISLNNFDEISGQMDMTVAFTFSWNEERIQWKVENYGNISSITVPLNNIWRPPIYLINAAHSIMEIGDEGVMVRVDNNGKATWNPGQVLKFTCSVYVKYYPFDIQKCEMMFVTWSYISSEVELEDHSKAINLTYYAGNSQWEFVNSTFFRGHIAGRKFMTYEFELKRRSQLFVVYLISPVLLLGAINNLVYVMPVSSGERMSVAITSYLAFAVYMGIINDNVPDNSDPMAALFFYLLFLMVHSTITIILTVVSLRIHDKKGPVYKPVEVLIKFLRFKYCRRGIWKNNSIRHSKVDVLDCDVKTSAAVYDSKSVTENCNNTMTWTMVGKTFDGYIFVLSVLLHVSISAGFIYSVYDQTF